jgi:hypothetical protein
MWTQTNSLKPSEEKSMRIHSRQWIMITTNLAGTLPGSAVNIYIECLVWSLKSHPETGDVPLNRSEGDVPRGYRNCHREGSDWVSYSCMWWLTGWIAKLKSAPWVKNYQKYQASQSDWGLTKLMCVTSFESHHNSVRKTLYFLLPQIRKWIPRETMWLTHGLSNDKNRLEQDLYASVGTSKPPLFPPEALSPGRGKQSE